MTKIYIILILATLLSGCYQSQNEVKQPINDTLDFITQTKWNINLNDIDSLLVYNHSTLYFNKDYLYFSKNKVGSFEFKKDTLIVKEIYYQHSKDTFIRKEKIKLIAHILQISHDSLVLEKLKGRGFYFTNKGTSKYFPTIKKMSFYNDTLNFHQPRNFDKICLSSSLCYGSCPSQAIEVLSNGEYKFFGGKYSKLPGYYTGKLSSGFIDSLKILLAASIVNSENLSNIPPIDAPVSDIKIISENDTINIYGCPSDFSCRLRELYKSLMKSYKRADLTKTDEPIGFITKSHIYDTTGIIPPPPPIEENYENY